jgi:hypothetical protein
MDRNFLHEIKINKIAGTDNWSSVSVVALDDESFTIVGGRGGRKVFRDEDLKTEKNGKSVINIEYLDLKFYFPDADLPKEFEMPKKVLEARKEKRRLNALAKDALFIDRSIDPIRYFYIEGNRLLIMQGGKEIVVDHIEKKYGKMAINAEGLELGHTHLVLPPEVAGPFEKVLKEKELSKLALVLMGKSLLNGLEYYGFNMVPSDGQWSQVEGYFEDFGKEDELKGWLTCEPVNVAEILRIPIEEGA